MHLWWKLFSRLICLRRGVQHSEPYSSTESTHALYTCLLVVNVRFLSLKTTLRKAPKALDTQAVRLSMSVSTRPLEVIVELR